MSVLIGNNPATFESYDFYRGELELRYNDANHTYYEVRNNRLIPYESVTTIVKIPDKSEMLIPWACKMAAEELMTNIPVVLTKSDRLVISAMPYDVFFSHVMDAKTAHRRRLEDAADIGKAAHGWLEQFIKHELGIRATAPPAPEDPQVLSCCTGALEWMDAHEVVWLQTERKVCSRAYGYAGTMDGLCYANSCSDPFCCPTPFKRRLSLIDFKSSNFLYVNYLMQTAGYAAALHEEWDYKTKVEMPRIQDRWLIRMAKKPEDSPKLFETWHMESETYDADLAAFHVCLDLTRTMRSLKARMKDVADIKKDHEKAVKAKERSERLMKACSKSATYQGVRGGRPKCIDGNSCATCLKKWLTNHPNVVVG